MLVDGLSFRVLESGEPAPGRPAIVLVHGIGVSHRYLSRLHDVLAKGRKVYSIDLPGFGGLPKPARDVDVPAMADALASRPTPAHTSELTRAVKQVEKQNDRVLRAATARLFAEEHDAKTLIKWKEIYEQLEAAVDCCEDVANLIEGVVLENA